MGEPPAPHPPRGPPPDPSPCTGRSQPGRWLSSFTLIPGGRPLLSRPLKASMLTGTGHPGCEDQGSPGLPQTDLEQAPPQWRGPQGPSASEGLLPEGDKWGLSAPPSSARRLYVPQAPTVTWNLSPQERPFDEGLGEILPEDFQD